MRVKHLVYASIIVSVPFFAANASAESASAEPTLWGIYGEWRDAETGQWFRTHGNEHWEFDDDGLMRRRDMSANDIPIQETERKF